MKGIIAHIFLSTCLLYPSSNILFFNDSYLSGEDVFFVSIVFIAGLILTAMLPRNIKELIKRSSAN
ncbi:hypothetical protein [Yersinia intermedia]|uniref:hypothetical protein n=1 Tax=Yersinia intermedia TaxID=631 RepID=UPI0005ABFB7A|nr:hypothetical protein [Yersinia intermedia]AJJ20648.1 putative membrane protein [Yersinia intermedia]